jgi:tripartite-type tricarboxylate transporter receptor subunit TctC
MKKTFLNLFLALSLISNIAYAQTVSFVTLAGPGSQSDTAMRYFLPLLSMVFSKDSNLIIENKPGANGLVGMNYVKQKPADGNTILIGNTSVSFLSATKSKSTDIDPIADFEPLYGLANPPGVILVSSQSGVTNFKEFLNLVKTKKKVLGGSISIVGDLIFKELDNELNIKTDIVNYKQASEMVINLASNLIDYTISGAGNAASQGLIDSGKLIPIAVLSDKRVDMLPNVPTLKELGYTNPVETFSWTAFFVLKSTPADVKASLTKRIKFIIESESGKKYEKMPGSPKLFHIDSKGIDEMLKREVNAIKKLS